MVQSLTRQGMQQSTPRGRSWASVARRPWLLIGWSQGGSFGVMTLSVFLVLGVEPCTWQAQSTAELHPSPHRLFLVLRVSISLPAPSAIVNPLDVGSVTAACQAWRPHVLGEFWWSLYRGGSDFAPGSLMHSGADPALQGGDFTLRRGPWQGRCFAQVFALVCSHSWGTEEPNSNTVWPQVSCLLPTFILKEIIQSVTTWRVFP